MLVTPTTRFYRIAAGERGSLQTLSLMRRLARAGAVDQVVIGYAKQIMPLDGKNRLLQAIAVRDTLAERVLFFRDPDGVELLYEPGYVVRQILERGYFQDDCDDYTTLAASLGKAAGLRARFVAMRFFDESQPLTHVYAELLTERGWLPIDRKASIPFPPELVIYKGFVEV